MPERQRIRLMPQDVVLKIAAGEVIERPASVVKELLDNAIDAGASTIAVEIREAGLKLIRVTDDGLGIAGDQLPMVFLSHATSKITGFDDLEHLTTLGFRGEALPSIAAVARVEVQTRAIEEEVGSRYAVEHGQAVAQGRCSAPPGVRITVSDLFSNVPARRKFVRSLRAEGSQIHHVVTQYALAQPAIRFNLSVDGSLTFHSPGNGSLRDALAAVYGADALDQTRPVQLEQAGMRVDGLISTPGLTRQNRTAISIIVNGRPVQNRSLAFALEEAYSGFLMTGRHPLAAIHLCLPPGDVDVNVHPSKSEVRFARDREVHGLLHRAVANALLDLRLETRELTIGSDALTPIAAGRADWPQLPEDEIVSQPEVALPGLPVLRVFGQANQMFIIAEGPDGLYMIDQHAAHERVLFDRLDVETAGGAPLSQPLLQPASVDLTPSQMVALEENHGLLTSLGFALEPFGQSACLVRSVPVLARGEPVDLVREVLDDLPTTPEPEAARERALAMVSCRAAVKAGQTLSLEEMRELVAQLERTLRPSTCPHGRPTMIHLSHSRLEREFGR